MSQLNTKISKEGLLENIITRSLRAITLASALLLPTEAPAYRTVPEEQSEKVNQTIPVEDRKICHRDLSFKIVELYRNRFEDKKTSEDLRQSELLFSLVQGAIDEDNITAREGMRFIQHFYNPERGEDEDGLRIRFFNNGSKDALTRAKNLWQQAIDTYRENNKKEAYHTLGRVMHLLEDMGVPEHVYLINHGPRLVKVACKDHEGHTKLHDVVEGTLERLLSRINVETDIDWDRCVTIDSGSSYEDYCNRTPLNDVASDYRAGGSEFLENLFRGMARATLDSPRIQDVLRRNYRVGETGNGRYVRADNMVSEEDCKELAEFLVPRVLAIGVSLLKQWDNSVVEKCEAGENIRPDAKKIGDIEGINFADYIFVPQHNIRVAKERSFYGLTWYGAHNKLYEQNGRMLTIKEFTDFIRSILSGDPTDGLGNKLAPDEVTKIYKSVTRAGRDVGEWLDARFVDINGISYINYDHRFIDGQLKPQNSEPLEGLMEDEKISFEYWLRNATSQGLPPRDTMLMGAVGKLAYQYPRVSFGDRVARFYDANFGDPVVLHCDWPADESRSELGVRLVYEKK